MPAPANAAEHLQDTIRRTYNPEVREWFADLTNPNPDITTPRGSLKTACTHLEGDTMTMTVARQLLFNEVRQQPQIALNDRDLNYRVLRRTRPKLTLFFLEDLEDADAGYRVVSGEISFRLMNQTSQTLSRSEATALGRKIKALFGASKGFVWKKGKVLCSYADWDKGYQLQLLVRNEAEGRRLVEQVLDIRGHAPEWEFFNIVNNAEPAQAYPTIPPTDTILGKRYKLPRRRPIADVRFQFAQLKLAGLPQPVCLYDRSGRYIDALVTNRS